VSGYRGALLVIVAGVLTFGIVLTLLEAAGSAAAPNDALVLEAPTPSPTLVPRPTDAVNVAADDRAIAVPIAGSEALLRSVRPGDRLDVLASLSSPDDGRPVTSVVVRGATVLRAPTDAGDPLLLQVPATDTTALAHLVLSGTRLGFTLWPTNATPPPPQPLDERTARALLGLTPLPAPTSVPVPPTPAPIASTAAPQPAVAPQTAVPTPLDTVTGAFLYQAQDGDTWDSVATTFKLTPGELRQWNNVAPDASLAPGVLVIVPRKP
jgi:hypothetical protein